MTADDQEPFRLLQAIGIRVVCALHGRKQVRNTAAYYPLGHGVAHLNTDSVVCGGCGGTGDWLQIEIEHDHTGVLEVSADDFRTALSAALVAEMGGDDQQEEASDEHEEPAQQVVPPSEPVRAAEALPGFTRRPTLGG